MITFLLGLVTGYIVGVFVCNIMTKLDGGPLLRKENKHESSCNNVQ
jgi:hypothetical protein